MLTPLFSWQMHKVCDDKDATVFVVDLLTLAPLVSGKEGSKSLTEYFSVASFAASLMLKALIDSYKKAALVHLAASQAADSMAFLAVHAPVPATSYVHHPLARISMLLSSQDKAERVCWEIKCAKDILKSALENKVMPRDKGEDQSVSVHSYNHAAPVQDRLDALCELLQMCSGYGPAGESWKQMCPSRSKKCSKGQPFYSLVDMLCSAPLAHARMHKLLFERTWCQPFMDNFSSVLLQLEGKQSSLSSTKELGLNMQQGKFGNGTSMFNSYADAETTRVFLDPLVHAHDGEWTQLGRISEAAQNIEAKMRGAEMSGGINGSMFFSMAAVEKNLELKIPAPVYPEMRRKNIVSLAPPQPQLDRQASKPALMQTPEKQVEPDKWEKCGQKSSTGMSFADMVRKRQDADKLAESVNTSVGRSAICNASKGTWSWEHKPVVQVDEKMASPSKPTAWSRPHKLTLGAATAQHSEPEPTKKPPDNQSKGAWFDKCCSAPGKETIVLAEAKGRIGDAPCSAAHAAQAATGIHFAETYNASHVSHTYSPALPRPVQPQRGTRQSEPEAPPAQPCYNTTVPSPVDRGGQQHRVRYNPLRPQHASCANGDQGRRATAKRLHGEIETFLKHVEPTEASRRHRDQIVDEVKRAVNASWPDACVQVYGSYSTNLFLSHSDVDLLVLNASASENKSPLQIVSERVRGMTWCRYIKSIENAAVPVVKLTADVSLLSSAKVASLDLSSPSPGASRSPVKIEHLNIEDEEEQRACIAVDVTFDCHTGQAPIGLRDFVCAQLKRFPIIRPLVLVLKHFLFKQSLNDVYKGGLSSNSLVLLLIFYFNIPEVSAAHEAGLDPASDACIDQECWYGEWMMRVMQWLSEFPFSDVGIVVEPMSFVPLSDFGYGMLMTGECDPALTDVESSGKAGASREANLLYIQDPFNFHNIAAGSFEWYLVRRSVQGAYRILCNHDEPSPHLRIFGGVAQRPSPLASIFDRSNVASSVEAVLKEHAARLSSRSTPLEPLLKEHAAKRLALQTC